MIKSPVSSIPRKGVSAGPHLIGRAAAGGSDSPGLRPKGADVHQEPSVACVPLAAESSPWGGQQRTEGSAHSRPSWVLPTE